MAFTPIDDSEIASSSSSGFSGFRPITEDEIVSPLNASEAMAGGMQQILNGVTFGGGDRITGAGAGLIDYLTGASPTLTEAVQNRTAQVQDLSSRYQQEHPYASTFENIAGAIQNPLSAEALLPAKATTVLKASLPGRVLLSSGTGALQGAAFNVGTGEGDLSTRLKEGAALGSLVGAGTGTAGQLLQSLSDDLLAAGTSSKLGALGIRASDIKTANQRLPKTASGAQQTSPLVQAVDDISKEGGFSKGYAPQDVLETIRTQSAQKGAAVTDIITAADQAGVTNIPNFPRTEKFIAGIKGTSQKQATQIYQDEIQGLVDTLDNGGTIGDWQKAKQSLQGQLSASYSKANPTLANEVKEKIASDIRQYVEDQTVHIADVGALNKQIGQRKMLDSVLERARAADSSATPMKSLIGAMRTSGGFGVPALITYGETGSPTKAIGAGLVGGLLASRGGQFKTGQVLQGLSSLFNKVDPSIITKAIASQIGESSNNEATPKTFIDNAMNRAEDKMAGKTPDTPVIVNAKRVDTTDVSQLAKVMEGVFHQESGGKADAVSKAGAKGVGQLMDATGKELFAKYKGDLPDGSNKKYDPFDATQNKILSTLYMKEMLDAFDGDLSLALTAYNSGIGRVKNLLKIHDASTLPEIVKYLGPDGKAYARSIMARLSKQGVLV